MKKQIIITIIIAIVVLVLGIRAINSWIWVRQTETMFKYGSEYRECRLKIPSYRLICK